MAQSVCQRALSLLEIRFLTPWVRILLSGEEDNLPPFDLKIACLCQSIDINNNNHEYCQSQVPKVTGSGVEWAEFTLIMGKGYWVFSLIFHCSVTLSASIQSVGDKLCIQQRKTTCLFSIRKSFACAAASNLTTTNMYIAKDRWESQLAVGSKGLNPLWS